MAADDKKFEDFRALAADMLERSRDVLNHEQLLELQFGEFAAKLSSSDSRGLSFEERNRAVGQAVLEHYFGDFHRDPERFAEASSLPSKAQNLRERYERLAFETWDRPLAGQTLEYQVEALMGTLENISTSRPDALDLYDKAFSDLAAREQRAGRMTPELRANLQHAQRALSYPHAHLPTFEKKQICQKVALGLMTDKERRRHDLPPQPLKANSLLDRLTRFAQKHASSSRTARIFLSIREQARKTERNLHTLRMRKYRRDKEQARGPRRLLSASLKNEVGEQTAEKTAEKLREKDGVAQHEQTPAFDSPNLDQAATHARDVSDTLEMPLPDTGELSPSSYEDAWENKFAHHLRANGDRYNFGRPLRTQALNALITDVLDDQAREIYQSLEKDIASLNGDGLGDIDPSKAYHDAGLPTRMEMVRAASRAAEHHLLTHSAKLLQYEYRERAHTHAQKHAQGSDDIKSLADCIEFEAITDQQAETYVLFSDVYEEINDLTSKELDKKRETFSVLRDRDRQLRGIYQPEETLIPDDRRLAAEHVSEGVQRDMSLPEIHTVSDEDFKNRLFSDYSNQLGHVAQLHNYEKTAGDLTAILDDADKHTRNDAPEGWVRPEAAQSFERFRGTLEQSRAEHQRDVERTHEVTQAAAPRSKNGQSKDEFTRNARPKAHERPQQSNDPHLRVTREAPKAMSIQGLEPPQDKHYQTLEHLNRYRGTFTHFAEVDGERVAVVENAHSYTTVATARDSIEPGTPVNIRKSKDERGNWMPKICGLGQSADKGIER